MAKHPTEPVLPPQDIKEIKPWRLPFWTQEPVWVSEKIHADLTRKTRVKVFRNEPQTLPESANEPEPILPDVEDEEVELSFPTAEELENIRREAYNAGLEQGLVEGRQKAQKEGYAEGLEQGQAEGKKQGLKEGRELGREQGLELGQSEIAAQAERLDALSQELKSRIKERDNALPEVLVNLIMGICRSVVGQELAQGAQGILSFVESALAQLPEGEDNIQIFISDLDSEIMQQSLLHRGRQISWQTDSSLSAGQCRVQSAHSLVEYQSQAMLDSLLEDAQAQLRHALKSHELSLDASQELPQSSPQDPQDLKEESHDSPSE